MQLTAENYFSTKNKYLTSSRLKDYRFDPWYFYRKHVAGEIIEDLTPSMRIGKAVDVWLTRGKDSFQAQFKAVDRRNLKNPPKTYTELTPSEWDRVFSIASTVEEKTVYKEIQERNYTKQHILTVEKKLGLFKGLAGIPDWYRIREDKVAEIIDLKTSSSVDPDKFRWACKDFSYFVQAAFYQILLTTIHPEIKSCVTYILAVENDDTTNRVKLFLLDQKMIDLEKDTINGLIEEIAEIKEFKPVDIAFKDAIEI